MPKTAEIYPTETPAGVRQPLNEEMFTAIQANIRRYGWQALVVRLTAIVLASVFILFSAFYAVNATPASFRLWPVVILFLMWMLDGHCKYLQGKYVDLSHDVLGGVNSDLSVKVDDSYNAASLWRPMVMTPYIVFIGLFALVNLGF